MRSAGERHENFRNKDWTYLWIVQGMPTVKNKEKITSSEVNAKKKRMVGGKPKSKQNKNFEF